MPTLTQERIQPESVSYNLRGDTLTISASINFISQNRQSWESKRNFLADKAVIAQAAQLSFGKRILFNLSETHQKMQARNVLEARYRGGQKGQDPKGEALAQALLSVDELVSAQEAETEHLLRYVKTVGKGALKTLDPDKKFAGEGDLAMRIKGLVADFAQSESGDLETLTAQADDVLGELRKKYKRSFEDGKTVVSDLVEVAQEARKLYQEHQGRLKNVDFDLSAQVGALYGGLQTREKGGLLDWLVARSQGKYSGKVINPVTVGAAAVLGALAVKAPAKSIPVIGGLAGGAFAAMRRYSKEKQDRNLKQREQEVGLETAKEAKPQKGLSKWMIRVLGKTDFSEFSYDLADASDMAEKLRQFVDRGKEDLSDDETVQLASVIVETQARLDIADEEGKATFVYGEGLCGINKQRFELATAYRMAMDKLGDAVGVSKREGFLDDAYAAQKAKLIEGMVKADRRFAANQKKQAAKSFGFAAGIGLLSGLGVHLAGEAVERVAEEGADLVSDAKEKVWDQVGNIEIHKTVTFENTSISVGIPQGFSAENHDQTMHLTSPDGRVFDVPLVSGESSPAAMQDRLREAGFEAHVTLDEQVIVQPAHTIQSEILGGEFMNSHNLADISGKDWDLSFGRGSGLTLRQITGTEWAVPKGDNFVAFYQLKDEAGNWHTMLADASGGKFNVPEEFINPQDGRLDAIAVVGYGVVKDANGNIISAGEVLANPDILNGGNLESLASIAVDQKERFIGGMETAVKTIKIENLAKVDEAVVPHDFNVSVPAVPLAFAPRVLPEVGRSVSLEAKVEDPVLPSTDAIEAMAAKDAQESETKAEKIRKTFLDWSRQKSEEEAQRENETKKKYGTPDERWAHDRPVTKAGLFSFSFRRARELGGQRLMTEDEWEEGKRRWGLAIRTQTKDNPYLPFKQNKQLHKNSFFFASFWRYYLGGDHDDDDEEEKPDQPAIRGVFNKLGRIRIPFWTRKREEEEQFQETVNRRLMSKR